MFNTMGAAQTEQTLQIMQKERDPVVGPFVSTHWLPQSAREHSDVVIVPPYEGPVVIRT